MANTSFSTLQRLFYNTFINYFQQLYKGFQLFKTTRVSVAPFDRLTMANFTTIYDFSVANAYSKLNNSRSYNPEFEETGNTLSPRSPQYFEGLLRFTPDFLSLIPDLLHNAENFLNQEKEMKIQALRLNPRGIAIRMEHEKNESYELFSLLVNTARSLLKTLTNKGWDLNPPLSFEEARLKLEKIPSLPNLHLKTHKDLISYIRIILALEIVMNLLLYPRYLMSLTVCKCNPSRDFFYIKTFHKLTEDSFSRFALVSIGWDYDTVKIRFNDLERPLIFTNDYNPLDSSDSDTDSSNYGSPLVSPAIPETPDSPDNVVSPDSGIPNEIDETD